MSYVDSHLYRHMKFYFISCNKIEIMMEIMGVMTEKDWTHGEDP